MRNLGQAQQSWIRFADGHLPLRATTWDTDHNALICAFGPTADSAVIELKRFDDNAYKPEDGRLITSWDAPCPLPDLDCDKILALKYLAEVQTVCLILAGGDIVLVREAPSADEDLIEIVGSIDTGIEAASWSPDDELVAICTRADTVIIMTRQFDSTANVALSPDDIKVSTHVSVGWGKKETQFHGKRAKALRDPTVPEKIDEGVLSEHDDGQATISWRGDGAYFALNRRVQIDGRDRRLIRVLSREAVLDSVSEPVDGLEGALTWRPAGNIITGIQQLSDRTDVVFFERNGLRHGQFTLRFNGGIRPSSSNHIALSWNVDSSILAVAFDDRIQLWTMGNYHYYLKQEIHFEHGADSVAATWHPEKPLYLSCSTSQTLRSQAFTFAPAVGPTIPPADFGVTAVIDGNVIKLTPLRLSNVPPPMSTMELRVDHNVIDVAIDSTSTRIAVLQKTAVDVFGIELAEDFPQSQGRLYSLSLADRIEATWEPIQVISSSDGSFNVLLKSLNREKCQIAYGGQNLSLSTVELSISGAISSLHTSWSGDKPVAQVSRTSGTSEICLLDRNTGAAERLAEFTQHCVRLEYWTNGENLLLFGLSAGGILTVLGGSRDGALLEQQLQIKGITSMLVTHAHLIITTSSHLVKFIHLHSGSLEVPLDEPEKDERCRAIERGARLITVMPSTYSLVMQMPRGNLETIYPRALVLAGIRKAITDKDYHRAFFACRNHRVDMNILHDFAPEQLLANVALFVNQIKKPVHIDLFLSQLREEDVCETLYKNTLPAGDNVVNGDVMTNGHKFADGAVLSKETKANRICTAFLSALSHRKSTHLQNIVTAHVSRHPPDLEAGLTMISNLRQSSPSDVDKAVEHICFLADVNRLYDAALGLYDLDVALLVAQQSQKDPREYLPYLQSLQDAEELRRAYIIDNDLKRYEKALKSLHKLDSWEELLRYTQRHVLYTTALDLVKYDKARLAEVLRIYAEWLRSQNKFREAGVAFESLEDYLAAMDCYRSAALWREALTCSQLAGESLESVRSFAASLAEGLEESKDWADAAKIYSEYLHDPQKAAVCFCKAYHFSKAISLVVRDWKPELLKTTVDGGIADAFGTLSEMLAEMKGQIQAQTSRLKELRIKKEQDPLSFYDDAPASTNPDIPDDVSIAPSDVTTSAGTFMTRYTNRTTSTLATNTTRRTSKNKRREERKKARGKKGSVYEEEYLVASIGRLVERLNSIKQDVQNLAEACLRRGMRERAAAVQGQLIELEGLVKECLPEVTGIKTGAGEVTHESST